MSDKTSKINIKKDLEKKLIKTYHNWLKYSEKKQELGKIKKNINCRLIKKFDSLDWKIVFNKLFEQIKKL